MIKNYSFYIYICLLFGIPLLLIPILHLHNDTIATLEHTRELQEYLTYLQRETIQIKIFIYNQKKELNEQLLKISLLKAKNNIFIDKEILLDLCVIFGSLMHLLLCMQYRGNSEGIHHYRLQFEESMVIDTDIIIKYLEVKIGTLNISTVQSASVLVNKMINELYYNRIFEVLHYLNNIIKPPAK